MFVLSISLMAVAQTSLRGKIYDKSTRTPVADAKITLVAQNISTTTNDYYAPFSGPSTC